MSRPLTPVAGPTPRRRWHWLLLAVPPVWCIGVIPLVNRVDYVLGSIPFLLVWMTLGVLIGSAALAGVYLVDRSRGDADRV
ncbi:DUF3311 domain-containing protein [Streptomyces rugosispiralis]|uniref:DUF3311 domain-containing protein n=1 Tax=Streptomyces rugosispiralis TaxID=2967341 RepID=A0ABT1URM3_9ACTN|nr:DUF3311 domain-containing protein [Streptomyces rugosispiralis]MCQ8186991.1 DUF3311 domain-containing protein [Streptomyces rugosispiralis]